MTVTPQMTARPLDESTFDEIVGAARPTHVRIVHIGLGNFHRAHQAWYTAHAADSSDWGIAAFTGRSPLQADHLRGQDGLYCLVVRGPERDRVEVVPSLVEVHDASRTDRFLTLLRDPAVAVVTLTITENGYRLNSDGDPDLTDPIVRADVDVLRGAFASPGRMLDDVAVAGSLSRLLLGLEARRRAGAGAIAIVPCDNIPANGEFVRKGLVGLAQEVSPGLAVWIAGHAVFVSSSVDRITPRIDDDVVAVREAGWIDASPVVAEPFSDWVLSGEFPKGRPQWETAGARFVDDLEPWENRKLWLLNGAHSILAFAGLTRGLETVSEAIDDEECLALVTDFWSEAVALLPDEIEHVDYRHQLLARFRNPRIVHRLSQIAADATTKVRYRFAAVAERTVAVGGDVSASAHAVAAWIAALTAGVVPMDADAPQIIERHLPAGTVRALVRLASSSLAEDDGFSDLVRARLAELTSMKSSGEAGRS